MSARTESVSARIHQAWRTDRFTLLPAAAIGAEIESVLRRPQVLDTLRVDPVAARALLLRLRRRVEFV